MTLDLLDRSRVKDLDMPLRNVALLLVEDDEEDKFLTLEILGEVVGTTYDVTWVRTADEAVAALRSGTFDIALLDYRLGAETGIDVLDATRDDPQSVPCILLTGQRDRDTDLAAMEAGAADYLVKADLSPTDLERAIRYAIDRSRDLRTLRESELRFRAVVEAASDAIVIVDGDGIIVTWNRAALDLFAIGADAMQARALSDLLSVPGGTPLDVRTGEHTEGFAIGADGQSFPVALSVSNWRGATGPLWSATLRDITTQRKLEERLVHQAFHDPLTQLANRALFTNRVEHALQRLRRRPGALATLFIDLDDFKVINDSYGHQAGDMVLTAVAERLMACVRVNDTVARLGGDEFAVLVEGADDPHVAVMVAERIMRAMTTRFEVPERQVEVSCSIGIAVTMSEETSGADLIRDADLAMYAAKARGKNAIELFEDGMHAAIMDRVNIESDLVVAIARGEITPYFQPILDLATGRIKGFEALARWRHPERGLLSPAGFIDVAESSGLIVEVGRSMLMSAATQTREWQQQFPDCAPLTVSVNLSSRQIDDDGMVEAIADALRVSGLAPEHLLLEISESVMTRYGRSANERVARLAELGVGVVVEDFGLGYSSLSYLQDLPVTTLKVDRSFVDRIAEAKGGALVEAIVAISRTLGLTTVAEGIETDGQLRALTEFGCVYGQGFLFAKPLSVDEVEVLLGGEAVYHQRRLRSA